jgi:hypothetical protein
MHELKQPVYAARIRFYDWLLQNVHDGIVDPQLLFMTYASGPTSEIVHNLFMRCEACFQAEGSHVEHCYKAR